MNIASGSAADWAGVGVTAVGGLIALVLLIFEIRTVRSERHLREAADRRAGRDLSLERARRVVGWIEPIMWQINRQGVVSNHPGGWKLVVSNDTDDTISNWRAVVVKPDVQGVDQALLEAAVVENGVIPPRSRFEADIAGSDAVIPPAHKELDAIVLLSWVDREAGHWCTRGAAGPFNIPSENGRWSVSDSAVASRSGSRREIRRPDFSVTRLN